MSVGRKRFAVFYAVIIIALLVTVIMVVKDGDHYKLKFVNTTYGDWVKGSEVEYSLDSEGVVNVERAYIDESDWKICLECTSVHKGRVNVRAWIKDLVKALRIL